MCFLADVNVGEVKFLSLNALSLNAMYLRGHQTPT